MEKTIAHKVKLGIFISLGVLLFLIGIFFIGSRQQLFSSTFHISGTFEDIGGLKIGDNIRFSGINVGIVDNIEQITDSTVEVGMLIEENTRKFIKSNARALIGSDGLMGNKIILISPGTPDRKSISNLDRIQTAQPVKLDDILMQLEMTSMNAVSITNDLAAILNNLREGKGTIGKLLMDTAFAENIDQTILNIKKGAGSFNQNMNAASKNVLLRGYFKKKEKKEKNK